MAETATTTQTATPPTTPPAESGHTGHLGSLTSDETALLKTMWRMFLQRLDSPTDDDKRQHAKLQEKRPSKKNRTHAHRHSHPAVFPPATSGSKSNVVEPASESAVADSADKQPTPTTVPTASVSMTSLLGPSPSTITTQLGAVYFSEFWNMCSQHHPDSILLRFLRARKWNLDKAMDMLWGAVRWRVDFEAHNIYELGERALPQWMNTSGVVYFHRTDLQNRPVILINSRFYDKSASPLEENKKQAVYIMELAKNYFVSPTVDTVCVVMDLGQFSMSNFDMGFTKFMISVLEAYYPESLGVVLIMNAPLIFNGIWKMIRPLLDPVVAAKVKFVTPADITNYIGKADLMKHMGGDDDYTYNYLQPPPIEADAGKVAESRVAVEERRRELANNFIELTRQWIDTDEAKQTEIAQQREKAETELRSSWWELDTYVERNLYHRMGVISPTGQVKWPAVA